MVNAYIGFIESLVPILVGLIILAVLKSLDYNQKRINIIEPWKQAEIEYTNESIRQVFLQFAKDELILNGALPERDVEESAFTKLSILPFWNLKLVKKERKDQLVLFAGKAKVKEIISVYSPISGIIFAHILNKSFRLVSYE